ncbi:MAG: acyltransferase family protein [Gemmatimonadaceae bacterium]
MPASIPNERLLSLDVFRGLTVAAMLLVNNPGTWSASYAPLQHARWHGWTPTDLIFPFFLFIVGITTAISRSTRRARGATDRELVRQVLLRGSLIVLLGLLLNAFPFFPLERITEVRIPGVLQRIGVAYAAGALLTLHTNVRQQIGMLAALLLGYWALMTLIPVPGQVLSGRALLDTPAASLAAWLDRSLFGDHLWRSSKTWDPEGILSTIPAVGTVILGVLAGGWLGTQRPLTERLTSLYGVAALLIVAGLVWNWVFPINKNLWTSSYVLFTGGMAALTLATCTWLVDVLRIRWWTTPFVVFGVNPLLAFIGSGAVARLIYSVIRVPYGGETVPVQRAIYESAFASWLDPRNASLLFAVTFVLVWVGLLWIMYRRRVYLRV